jgi:hypothetical protein
MDYKNLLDSIKDYYYGTVVYGCLTVRLFYGHVWLLYGRVRSVTVVLRYGIKNSLSLFLKNYLTINSVIKF